MDERIRILLVDDDPDYIEYMSLWLKAKGYSVSGALSGEKAIQIIKEQTIHLVFLDIKMPIMDGIETLKRIREFNQKLPVIVVTAYADEEKFVRTQQLNVSGFFAKDKDLKELLKMIDFTLKTYKRIWKKNKLC